MNVVEKTVAFASIAVITLSQAFAQDKANIGIAPELQSDNATVTVVPGQLDQTGTKRGETTVMYYMKDSADTLKLHGTDGQSNKKGKKRIKKNGMLDPNEIQSVDYKGNTDTQTTTVSALAADNGFDIQRNVLFKKDKHTTDTNYFVNAVTDIAEVKKFIRQLKK